MGNTLMSLLVRLGLDSKELDQGLANAEKKSTQSMDEIGSNMKKTGLAMSAALTVPIAMAAVKFVKSASDMAESVSKVEVVFGTSAKGIIDWSKNSATAMGMSSQAALEAAGTYGNLFQAMGLAVGPAEDMSKSVVQLAADLASFNNSSPEETLLALRSGLSGEMEPLKKFGVAMNEAALSAMAMEMGLGDSIQALTEAEKMQVRYAVIMSQTTMAQGDFARTAEGMANQTRILKAQISNVSATMGEQLLPIALKLVTKLAKLVDIFASMTPEGQKTVLIIGGIAAALGPLLLIVGNVLIALPKLSAGLGVVKAAFAASSLSAGGLATALGALAAPLAVAVAGFAALGWAYNKDQEYIAAGGKSWIEWRKTVGDSGQTWSEYQALVKSGAYAFDDTAESLANVAAQAQNITDNINAIPTSKDIFVSITTNEMRVITTMTDATRYSGQGNRRAAGGFISTGEWGLVGDSLSGMPTGYEELIHAVPGGVEVIPNHKVDAYAGGTGSATAGETTINIYNPIAETASNSIDRELKKLSYLGVGG